MTRSYIRYIRYPIEVILLWFALALVFCIFLEARGMTYDPADESKIDLALLVMAMFVRLGLSGFRDMMQGDVKR